MFVRELELLPFNVHAGEVDRREFLSKDRQYRADSAADLEEACARLEFRAVTNEAVPPVLGLIDEPMLLACPVSVNILGYVSTLGSG
jgi:hypothetical protein